MIVRFETNVPQRITLKFAEGREVEGQFGIQYLHSLLPEGQVYLSPAVADRLRELEIRDGETVEVCKREVRGEGNRRRTEWQVGRVAAQPSTTTSAAPPVSAPASSPRSHNVPSGARQTRDTSCQLSMDRACF